MRSGELTPIGMERGGRGIDGVGREETHLGATDGTVAYGGCAWDARRAHGGAYDGER